LSTFRPGYVPVVMTDRILSSSAASNKSTEPKTPDLAANKHFESLHLNHKADKENSFRTPIINKQQHVLKTPKTICTKRSASTSAPLNGMSADLSDADKSKRAAAFACGEDHVRSGQKIGVGSGTTAKYLVEYIKEKFNSGELTDICCVPTSFLTRKWLLEAGLPIATPEQVPTLDIAIDGADEIDGKFACIKGGGGCLTQEKIVQSCASKFILIAGKDKLSTYLGQTFKYIPIEVVPFAYNPVRHWVEKQHGGHCELRMSKTKCGAVITDNNNYILDWHFPESSIETDWNAINTSILCRAGVVETGLFIDSVNYTYLGSADGDVTKRRAK